MFIAFSHRQVLELAASHYAKLVDKDCGLPQSKRKMYVRGHALLLQRVVEVLNFLDVLPPVELQCEPFLALHNTDGNSSSSHWASINLMIAQSPSVEYHLNS